MAKGKSTTTGGLKGFFLKAGSSFSQLGAFSLNNMSWLGQKATRIFVIVASTSMVTLMPLLFEIGREVQALETERVQVKDFRQKGYTDRQLQEMGFSDSSIHSPSVALVK